MVKAIFLTALFWLSSIRPHFAIRQKCREIRSRNSVQP